jgi:L-iditol 2-dehydrogenase
MAEVYPRAIELVAKGKVDVASLVTDEIPLDEAPTAFRKHAENAPDVIKTLIYPNDHIKKGD